MTEHVAEVVEEPKKKGRKPKAKKEAPTNEETAALVAAAEQTSTEVLTVVSGYEIESQDDMDMVGQMKREARDRRESLDARLKEITAPMRAAEKSVRDLFRPAISTNTQIENICTEAIRRFELRKMEERRAALKQIEATGGKADEATLAVAHGHGVVETSDLVSTRKVFRFEVKDPEQIPERYWRRVLDEKLIQTDIDEARGNIKIAGVEVIEDVEVRNKARR